MGSNRLLETKRFTFNDYRVDFNTGYGMHDGCHCGPFLFMKGQFWVDVFHDMNHVDVVITTLP